MCANEAIEAAMEREALVAACDGRDLLLSSSSSSSADEAYFLLQHHGSASIPHRGLSRGVKRCVIRALGNAVRDINLDPSHD